MGGLGGKEEGEENSRAAVGFEAGGVLLPESGWMSGPNTQPDQEPLGWQPCARAQSLSRVQLFVTHGLAPARLLCPWSFPGKNTGVGCHFFLQGIFWTWGLNPRLLHCRQILYSLRHQGSPTSMVVASNLTPGSLVEEVPLTSVK